MEISEKIWDELLVKTLQTSKALCFWRLCGCWQELKVWHAMLTLGFVKGTRGYVKKAEPKPCLCIFNN